MEYNVIETLCFVVDPIAIACFLLAFFKSGYYFYYISECKSRMGIVTGRIRATQTSEMYNDSDVMNTIQASFYFLRVRFFVNSQREVEVRTNSPAMGEFAIGDEVEVTFLDDPSEIEVDYERTGLEEVKMYWWVTLGLGGLAIALHLSDYIWY